MSPRYCDEHELNLNSLWAFEIYSCSAINKSYSMKPKVAPDTISRRNAASGRAARNLTAMRANPNEPVHHAVMIRLLLILPIGLNETGINSGPIKKIQPQTIDNRYLISIVRKLFSFIINRYMTKNIKVGVNRYSIGCIMFSYCRTSMWRHRLH
jgi:hypothetical protein